MRGVPLRHRSLSFAVDAATPQAKLPRHVDER